ncbi:GntR family transcriptional regulator [Cumulibacter manganitolerans]|uniref:GntR family transcriptional regulator n=1 Tax=Cumulibacter manganitolerans TaxID=1884992 RepID=UPI001297155E|nr:GntR family transcriptional regulator [Cumulibacter manganitolerans]
MSTASLHVEAGDPTPPFEQLRRQLSSLIVTGALEAGRRLPPVRQLAADLRLSPGTVARTYRELEQAGLVQTRRGAGTRVRPGLVLGVSDRRRAELDRIIAAVVAQARALGATDAEIGAAVTARLGSRSR